jgi:hypothetical protein
MRGRGRRRDVQGLGGSEDELSDNKHNDSSN